MTKEQKHYFADIMSKGVTTMQNDMRDRLVEIMKQASIKCANTIQCDECVGYGKGAECGNYLFADHLIANGVVVIDMNVISPENRPLITQFANTPLDELFNLIKADVVPVVRCKDCKYSTERQGFENRMWNDDCVMCDHIAPSDRIPMNKNDFCSYGERKDAE